eukprot:NODE_384_length_9596_cov_0.282510.p3 type:complete len:315 gc:universal NODE_384_length_9596_cov_0.282510:5240-6184(+)
MQKDLKGFILVTSSAFCFSLMSVFVKSCSLPSSQIVFVRSLFQTLISVAVCLKKEDAINPFGRREIRKLLILRGLFGALAVGCYFYGVRYGNLGDVTAVFFTAPAMSTILASIFLKEKLRFSTIVSIILCMIGTTLVAKPQFLIQSHSAKDGVSLALIIAIFGAFLSAAAYLMISVIGNRSHHLCMVFYFGFISTLVSALPMAIFNPAIPGMKDTLALLGVVLFAYSGQVTLNRGLQLTSNTATLMRNLDIVFAFLYSFFIFHEGLKLTSIIGAVLICFGTGLIVLDKYKSRQIIEDIEIPSSPVREPLLSKTD